MRQADLLFNSDYYATEDGYVYSKDRVITCKNGTKRSIKGKKIYQATILKSVWCTITINGEDYACPEVIYEAFNGEIPEGYMAIRKIPGLMPSLDNIAIVDKKCPINKIRFFLKKKMLTYDDYVKNQQMYDDELEAYKNRLCEKNNFQK